MVLYTRPSMVSCLCTCVCASKNKIGCYNKPLTQNHTDFRTHLNNLPLPHRPAEVSWSNSSACQMVLNLRLVFIWTPKLFLASFQHCLLLGCCCALPHIFFPQVELERERPALFNFLHNDLPVRQGFERCVVTLLLAFDSKQDRIISQSLWTAVVGFSELTCV